MKHPRTKPTLATLAVLLAVALSSSACLFSNRKHTEHTGTYIGPTTYEQVQPGRSKDYVLALFGEPTSRVPVEETTELWKWSYSIETSKDGSMIFIFASSKTEQRQGAVFVEFTDDVVSKVWRD